MSLHIPFSVTTFLAIWGALLSSATFGWNLRRDLSDRARLQLTARVRKLVVGADGQWFAASPNADVHPATDELYVVMSVVNVGRRPVQWQSWGGCYRRTVNNKTGIFIVGRDLPKMLNEGESHQELTVLGADLLPANDKVKTLSVSDASGKEWKLSWWQMRKLRNEAKQFGIH
jgi:hypothetical protein